MLQVEYNQSTWLVTNHLEIMFENYSKNILANENLEAYVEGSTKSDFTGGSVETSLRR